VYMHTHTQMFVCVFAFMNLPGKLQTCPPLNMLLLSVILRPCALCPCLDCCCKHGLHVSPGSIQALSCVLMCLKKMRKPNIKALTQSTAEQPLD
jgi:hypothetical protein